MRDYKEYNEFYEFMREYVDFFDVLEKKEEEKLKLLYSREAQKLEELLEEYQLLGRRVAGYEEKREKFHKKLGFGDMTFKEMIESEFATDTAENVEWKERFGALHQRLKTSVNNTKHFNEKALEYAQLNMDLVNMINEGEEDLSCYGPGGEKGKLGGTRPTFLNTEI